MKSTDDTPSDNIVPEAKDLWTQSENKRRTWLKKLCNQVYDKFISLSYNNINSSLRESTEGDRVREYTVQLLCLGCFYQEYSDVIREGDGGRVLHCWKYMIY